MTGPFLRVGNSRDELGEGPLWDAEANCLYWLNVIGRAVYRLPGEALANSLGGTGPAAGLERQKLPSMPGSLAMRAGGGLLIAFRNGFGRCEGWGEPFASIPQDVIDFASERINDGAVDRAGRFWFGTFAPTITPGAGCLYRMDPDYTIHRMDRGITMSNGIAWSPDDKLMYYADSRPGKIYRYPFSLETGELGPREVFREYAEDEGHPDGCTVDAEGHLWVAEPFAGRISRYAPDGTRSSSVDAPVTRPTSLIFGGNDLQSLFVTTMFYRPSTPEQEGEELAGAVFVTPPGVTGLPEPKFAG